MDNKIYDICIIGGGINGTGIAVEAAGHGLSVALCERDDLGSHTSSASSKLIHGGLRYLEQKAFKLVRESLTEREILLHKAPHLIHPIKFLMPQKPSSRPAWLIRLGLFLYDHLGRRSSLPHCESISFNKQKNNPLKSHIRTGFTYFDCQVDDSRLVIANALKARELGAQIWTRTECLSATQNSEHWQVTCYDHQTNTQRIIKAKALVNATGPWTEQFLTQQCEMTSPLQIRLVKGSHIVFPKLYPNEEAYILQNKDGRIVFVVPFQKDFTMIGTTDVPYDGDPKKVHIDDAEKQYLCDVYNEYFSEPISPDCIYSKPSGFRVGAEPRVGARHDSPEQKHEACDDGEMAALPQRRLGTAEKLRVKSIVYYWSGVRPLYDDHHANPAEVTRDYKLDLQGGHPILSVFGGKITTYRHLAEQAFALLKPFFPDAKKYDSHSDCLPGGMIPNQDLPCFIKILEAQYPYFPKSLLERYATLYGSRIFILLENKHSPTDLGHHYGHDLYETEVRYLKKYEWARTVEDILWRRTKLGLYFSAAEQEQLRQQMSSEV